MRVIPLTHAQAAAFVARLHRHNKPPPGSKFCLGAILDGNLVGVVMAGRPIARMLDDGYTLEVNRSCTDGTRNANSFLYGAAWRTAKAMGYVRCITYTQNDETGATLRAVGWTRARDLPPRKSWAESSGPDWRQGRDPIGNGGMARVLWEIRSGLGIPIVNDVGDSADQSQHAFAFVL